MKRVAFGELELESLNYATDRLTENPERMASWGSSVYARNRKGLRDGRDWRVLWGERDRARSRGRSRRPGATWAEDSLTLSPKAAIQLTTLLPSHPEGNALRNVERGGVACVHGIASRT
jgi:hypothetical protein